MYNALAYRPNVQPKSSVMQLIAPGTCWHFDAWLFIERHTGALILHVQTRRGGRDLLTDHMYRVENGQPRYAASVGEGDPITLQDRAQWPRFAELNELHWRHIVPMAARVPAGFKSRSVALHYIRAPALDPFAGDEVNLHQYERKSGVLE